ncbi:MAG: transposase [Verrucomicrobiota bacterium]
MPRKPRVEYAGAIYHVMSRGDRGEAIVKDDADRERFIKTLADVCGRTGWIVHAYVLMDNHYHLLVETPEANLIVGMQWLQGTYTVRYNVRHHVHGHLFQGRYKALIMDPAEDSYVRRVSTYIHLNPARAGQVPAKPGGLRHYRWSSYPLYLACKGHRPTWLKTNWVLESLGIDPNGFGARRRYAKYLESCFLRLATESGDRELEAEWKEIRRGWCLGGSKFREQILDQIEQVLNGREKTSYSGEEVKNHDEMMADRKLQEALAICKLSRESLRGMRKGHEVKRVIAWALRKQTTVSNRWLSNKLDLGHPANVPGYVRSVVQVKTGSLLHLRRQIEEILQPE